jgi:phosphoglycerol transferase MdoB-like AlkP superfamily enzyme
MNGNDGQMDTAERGSLLKGIGLASLCQFAYLFFFFELTSSDVRNFGFLLFALVQFAYLFPLAIFFQKQNQGLTSYGIIIAGVLSLLAAGGWFGYSAVHGTLPSVSF